MSPKEHLETDLMRGTHKICICKVKAQNSESLPHTYPGDLGKKRPWLDGPNNGHCHYFLYDLG